MERRSLSLLEIGGGLALALLVLALFLFVIIGYRF